MFVKLTKSAFLSLLLLFSVSSISAEEKKSTDKNSKKETKTFAETIEGKDKFTGFVDIYRDKKDGSGYLVIDESQFGKPFLYFASTVNGASDTGHFKGNFRESRLIEFRLYYDRVDIIAKTPRYYIDPNNAVSKATDSNMSEAVLVSAKVVVNEAGKYVIKLKDVFMNEKLHQVSPTPSADPKLEKKRFKLGKLSSEKSRILEIDNFPENTHIVVDYVYESDKPQVRGGEYITDPRYVTVTLQHAFIQLPEDGFTPRRDDPRVGYFGQQFDDLTSDQTTNYRDVINRWHLEKKDPSAKVSDPVKPITWWIENTTPLEWRDIIRDATLSWNLAFEKAGFSNAIVVKVQPDDADWKAEDVRYNVLRWTASPRPLFSGYGPSLANPQTGQIIAADIMLEYSSLKGYWLAAKIFTDGSDKTQTDLIHDDVNFCSAGFGLSQGVMFGQTAALANGMGDSEKDELLRQSIYSLIAHEVGHTLGLYHNMMASQLYDHKQVHDADLTQGILSGSVMDYEAINFAPNGTPQGDFFTVKPGPYDDWAIEYGYSQGEQDEASEALRLQKILARSAEHGLQFGNDADDMRAPGVHIDPRINIDDMSSNAVAYAKDRFELIKSTATELKDKILIDGKSHHDLVIGMNVIFGEFKRQANVVSRFIGGVYLERTFIGQKGHKQPFTPVPKAKQKEAMQTLSDYIFAPGAIDSMEPLFAYLQRQRRGLDAYGKNEDPKLHNMLLTAQKAILDHVLHPNTLMRLTDSGLYGNEYQIDEVMSDLTQAIFDADKKSSVETYRRNLQVEYVERLIKMSGLEKASTYDYMSQATAVYQLNQILDMVGSSKGNRGTKVHRFFLNDRINRAFHKSKS
jgi:hypothetical protein